MAKEEDPSIDLIEVMVVVAIVALLIGLAMLSYSRYIRKAKVTRQRTRTVAPRVLY